MKKSTLLLFAIFSLLFQVNAQVAIGAGDLQSENAPFEPYFGYSYAQTIYLASEINASGDITDIQWYYSGTSDLPNSQGLVIYMAESPKTEFGSTTDWEPISSFTQVYEGGITVTAGEEGWVTITLDTPFTYAGAGNLMIAVEENADGFDEFGDDFYNSQVTANRTISYFSDSNNPDPASPPTANNIDDTIPNIILGGITQACPTPSNIVISNITSSGADISWTVSDPLNSFNIEIVPTGTTPTGTPTVTGITSPYAISALDAITGYDIYIQADCSTEESAFAGPVSFSTLCDVYTPDYLENFTTITPDCWEEADNGDATTGPLQLGTSSWGEDGFLNNGTTGAYQINLWLASKSDWIISPQFDLTGGPFQVEFDFGIMVFNSTNTAGTLGSDDTVQLLITTDNGTSWTSLLTYDSSSVVPATGTHPIVDLTAYSGQTVQFAIIASEGTVDDPEDNQVFVDNFQVRNIPTCAEPSDLTATNLSLTSTEVGWTEAGTSTSWNIQYGEAGFELGTGTVVANVATNPYVLEGLIADTSYEFYVQAICGTVDESSWTGPFQFFTGYCESIPSTLDGDGVNSVTIGVQDFTSFGVETYENHTTPVVNVFQGIDTTVEIEFGHTFTYDVNIWIDFNDDLVFDAGELVYQGESLGGDSPHTLDASFTMPATATVGEHRMRIGSADFGQVTPEPCYNGNWGVTLDFTVNIQELLCTLAEADYSTVPDCENDQFFIDVNITSLGDASSLELSNNFNAETLQAFNVDTYQVGPFPFGTAVKVFVMNEQDNNCIISSDTFQVLACPPINDECSAATVAVVNDGILCEATTSGTILAATPSNAPEPSCGGATNDDVWFQFVAQSESHLIALANISGDNTSDIDHTVYEGTCGNLTEISCTSGFAESSSVASELTIGETYFIRIYSGGTSNDNTTFDLCITPYNAPNNISCDLADNYCSGSDASDILYTYNTIEVLPGEGTIDCLFTTPNPTYSTLEIGTSGDILIEMVQNSAFDSNDNPIGVELDVDFILWGPFAPGDDLCNLASVVDCSYSPAAIENVTLLGAQQGEIYLLLITNYAEDAGVIQVRQTNVGEDGSGSTIADINAEITSQDVIFVDSDNDPTTPVEANACGFESVTLETDSPFADEFVWYQNDEVMEGETSSTLIVTETGNYQVQAFDTQCNSNALSQIVKVNLYLDAGNVEPQSLSSCDGLNSDDSADFDLAALSTSLGLGDGFTVSYYTSEADANQAMNAVDIPYTSSGETLIMRIEDVNAANNNFLGCRQLSSVELVVNATPMANQIDDFVVCDDIDGNVDGVTDFDLISNDALITADTDVAITYHNSQDNAEAGTGALTSPYSSGGETIYARVENTTTGCFNTISFNLDVNIVPLATFDQEVDYAVCPNATSPIQIGITPSNFDPSDVSVTWSLNGVPLAGGSGLTFNNVLLEGDYTAEITFNATGCVNTVTQFVMELETCVIPEGISPGVSPGLNDNFDLSSYNVTKLEIFNRYGTLVYSKNNYKNEWEGQTNDGKELPVGTYFYTMEYEGGAKRRSAWIYINR